MEGTRIHIRHIPQGRKGPWARALLGGTAETVPDSKADLDPVEDSSRLAYGDCSLTEVIVPSVAVLHRTGPRFRIGTSKNGCKKDSKVAERLQDNGFAKTWSNTPYIHTRDNWPGTSGLSAGRCLCPLGGKARQAGNTWRR